VLNDEQSAWTCACCSFSIHHSAFSIVLSIPATTFALAASASPTTHGSMPLCPVRRPVTAEPFFTPGPAKSWAGFFRAPREE
jgi:hypothetical protein